MNSKKIKNIAVILCCALVAVILNGCQKEITGSIDSFGCKVTQWNPFSSVSGFTYAYDSATAKPTQLVYTDFLGSQTTVTPIFKGDTVFFATGSYAVLDGSKRIKHLVEGNAISSLGTANGDYYYEYDAGGHISKRTYDDGTNSYVSNATFTGDALTKFTRPYGTVSDVIGLTYTYSDSIKVSDFNYFMLARNDFPELQFYLPCFGLGIFTTKAIVQEDVTVLVPVITLPPTSISFNNYVLNGNGYISSVAVDSTVAGVTTNSSVSASYICK